MQFGGRQQDGGNRGSNLRLWKGGSQDVLSCNVLLRIVSKVLVDKRVLGGRREEVLFLVFTILGFVGGDVSEDVKTKDRGGGDRGAGNDISGAVRDIKEGVVFRVVKDRPSELGGWGMGDKRSGCWGPVRVKIWTWEIPSVVVRLENFKDSGGSVSDVLLIYVIEGRPRSDGDVGEGGGGDNGGL